MTAQTTAQRQEALRAKREMLGLTEVRSIYLPPELHAALKDYALGLLTQWVAIGEALAASRKDQP